MSRLRTANSGPTTSYYDDFNGNQNDFDDYDYASNYGLDPDDDDYHLLRPISTADLQDEYPIGDVIPSPSPAGDGLVHEGNRYVPAYSTNDHDVYELQQVIPAMHSTTTNNDEYYWKEGAPRRASRTPEDVQPRNLPRFTGETTNNATYMPHAPAKRDSAKNTPEAPAAAPKRAPFGGQTSHQAEFTEKNAIRTRTQRPRTQLGPNAGNFEGQTTTQVAYQQNEMGPPTRYMANDNIGVGGEFFGATTNAADFVQHPTQKRVQRKHSTTALPQGAMASDTTNRQVYTPKKSANCPSEKLLLAQKQNKLAGRFKNGHFFVPVTKSGKVKQQLDLQTKKAAQNSSKTAENQAKMLEKRSPAVPEALKPRNGQEKLQREMRGSPARADIYPPSRDNAYSPPPAIKSPISEGYRILQSPDNVVNNHSNVTQNYRNPVIENRGFPIAK